MINNVGFPCVNPTYGIKANEYRKNVGFPCVNPTYGIKANEYRKMDHVLYQLRWVVIPILSDKHIPLVRDIVDD